MVETGVKGKIVLVSSAMGLIGFAGYSSYSPSKYALRGLAEGLRNEFLMYGIKMHIYYPGTMFTPGYENENLTKPLVTREIEGSSGLTPEEAARGLMAGLRKGYFAIATDFDTNFLRVACKGVSPSNNIGLDYILGLAAPVSCLLSDSLGLDQIDQHSRSFSHLLLFFLLVWCCSVLVGEWIQGQGICKEAPEEGHLDKGTRKRGKGARAMSYRRHSHIHQHADRIPREVSSPTVCFLDRCKGAAHFSNDFCVCLFPLCKEQQ